MWRLPEIGEESSEKNPLLKDDNLPEFNTFTIEKCIAAIGKQTIEFEEKMKSLEKVVDCKYWISIEDEIWLTISKLKEFYIENFKYN